MGNDSTKMEVNFDGDEPFKPGEAISGEVIVTTTKPLKRISGMEIKFNGKSRNWTWKKLGWETDFSCSRAIKLSVDGTSELGLSATMKPGIHRFAFSFKLPENSPSTFFSDNHRTSYNIEAILHSHGRKVMNVNKFPGVVADPADDYVNDDDGRPVADEVSLSFGSVSLARGTLQMKLQLPKAVFSPGEDIPISGTIVNDSQRPVRINAGIFAKDLSEPQQFERATILLCSLKPRQQITWNNEKFIIVKPAAPTEASLFEELRNQRRVVITMEQIGGWKPKRLILHLPVRIAAACRSPADDKQPNEEKEDEEDLNKVEVFRF